MPAPADTSLPQAGALEAPRAAAMLVAKLKGARDRNRRAGEKVEGSKSIAETKPETVELARKLARACPKRGERSLREIISRAGRRRPHDQERHATAATAIKLVLGNKGQ
jgi:hypothetical protein